MLKFLREKIKNSIFNFSKKIEDEGKEEVIEEIKEPEEEKEEANAKEQSAGQKEEKKGREKSGFFARIKERFAKKDSRDKSSDDEGFKEARPISEPDVEKEKKVKAEKEELEKKEGEIKAKLDKKEFPSAHNLSERKEYKEKIIENLRPNTAENAETESKGILEKIRERVTTKRIDEKQFEDLFWSLETTLLENNVAVEVIEKIKKDMKKTIVDKPIKRLQVEKTIKDTISDSIKGLFEVGSINIIEMAKQKKPLIVCFVGINGSGKTTTIAKVAKLLKDNGLKSVISASDTFRAASIEQLQQHADNLGLKLIKHDYGADPAAVAFDAIKHASSKNIDAVLIDTAGRMHSNVNLIDELKKIVRVAKPDLNIFVGEAITGNDCCDQIKQFNEAIGIDAIILTKADIDEKGGAMVSASYISKKPIIYLGIGQGYSDLKEFEPDVIIRSLGLEA